MSSPTYDPVYLHARKEAGVVIGLFTLALAWSIGSYYVMGYIKPVISVEQQQRPDAKLTLATDPRFNSESVSTTLGMPTWVFTGILLPWLAIDLVAYWFCFHYMADDDLGPVPEDSTPE